jgi:hypothetical protein
MPHPAFVVNSANVLAFILVASLPTTAAPSKAVIRPCDEARAKAAEAKFNALGAAIDAQSLPRIRAAWSVVEKDECFLLPMQENSRRPLFDDAEASGGTRLPRIRA